MRILLRIVLYTVDIFVYLRIIIWKLLFIFDYVIYNKIYESSSEAYISFIYNLFIILTNTMVLSFNRKACGIIEIKLDRSLNLSDTDS